ncbi:MAG: hypothetical protein K1X95_13835 [Acidimicrobiia bacterium]|nr:hypothetical protein [Acidimicrobiia bacterium]
MSDRRSAPVPLWVEDQWAAAAARVARWKVVALILALAAWAIPSLFVGLVGLVGLFGWDGDNGSTVGLVDGNLDGMAAIALAAMCDIAAGISLVAITRWALHCDRRTALIIGVAGTFWAQVGAAVWLATT